MIGKLFDCLVGMESEAKALEILSSLDFEDLDYLKILLKVKDDGKKLQFYPHHSLALQTAINFVNELSSEDTQE